METDPKATIRVKSKKEPNQTKYYRRLISRVSMTLMILQACDSYQYSHQDPYPVRKNSVVSLQIKNSKIIYYNFKMTKSGERRVIPSRRTANLYLFEINLHKFGRLNFDLFIELTFYNFERIIQELSVGVFIHNARHQNKFKSLMTDDIRQDLGKIIFPLF